EGCGLAARPDPLLAITHDVGVFVTLLLGQVYLDAGCATPGSILYTLWQPSTDVKQLRLKSNAALRFASDARVSSKTSTLKGVPQTASTIPEGSASSDGLIIKPGIVSRALAK